MIKAREDRQRLINDAIGYANAIIPEAQGQAQRLNEQAQGYRESVVAKAQGESNRFNSLLTEYRQAPQVMRDRMYLDTMTEVLSNTSKVLIDINKSSPLMVLPLDKLNRGNASGADPQQDVNVTPSLIEQLRNNSAGSSNSSQTSGIRREGRQ